MGHLQGTLWVVGVDWQEGWLRTAVVDPASYQVAAWNWQGVELY
jgi:hypothetical protein